jgi:catechol 2,3-dioxygenase-like lactoylglutathione lyase family enzyme
MTTSGPAPTIDHVTLRVSDLGASADLFTRVFDLLEFAGQPLDSDRGHEWNDFSITGADEQHPPTRGLHVAFAAASREQVDGWWRALTGAGYVDDGAPGVRRRYRPDYYGAFIRDGDGNSIEAVHHERATAETGVIDHLWIRVANLSATRRFYSTIARAVNLETHDGEDDLQVVAGSGTFLLLAGPPTRNLHLAIGVDDAATVQAFHRAGLQAGGRDNGGPGERPEYHAGYYGAYVLDPDGNNVEAVWHNRRST